MKIFPAIDIIGGRAVRLTQGDYNKQKTYSDSPVDVCQNFKKLGAKYLHVVDLDGAKTGNTENYSVIEDIIAFVEVKTRHTGSLVSGFEAVTASKQRFIIRTAEAYLLRNGSELQPRFDVAAVEYDGERICGIDYIENAFDASR